MGVQHLLSDVSLMMSVIWVIYRVPGKSVSLGFGAVLEIQELQSLIVAMSF